MKKLIGICIMVLALCAFSIQGANAAGPWCINLSPGGFCDKIEVARDGNLNLYGRWDSDCVVNPGTFPTLVQGSAQQQVNNLVGEPAGIGASFQFYFNVPARTLNFWAYDGVNPPFLGVANVAWAITPGQCPNSASEEGLPALTD